MMHRLQAPLNAYHEAVAHRATLAGALELIVTLDTYDFMRVKRRLRARYAQPAVVEAATPQQVMEAATPR